MIHIDTIKIMIHIDMIKIIIKKKKKWRRKIEIIEFLRKSRISDTFSKYQFALHSYCYSCIPDSRPL